MKKLFSWLLILCMLLSIMPAAFADEGEAASSQVQVYQLGDWLDQEDWADSEEQLDYYAQSIMYSGDTLESSAFAFDQNSLSKNSQVLYATLEAQIKDIIEGKQNSYFSVTPSAEIKFTWDELEVKDSDSNTAIMTKAYDALDFEIVMTMLLSNMPYELYWYGKTDKTYSQIWGSIDRDNRTVTVTSMQVLMPVSQEYQKADSKKEAKIIDDDGNTLAEIKDDNGNTLYYYGINTEKIEAAKKARENAQKIIDSAKELQDYDKLVLFKNEICDLTGYNDQAAQAEKTAYGDPWQMIYVFDGDEDTNVVCEGYAKAFQYLCDNGGLNAVCYTVTGTSQKNGGDEANHMWNIVKIGDECYLVDVTNSDEGTVGKNGQLFLVGANGSNNEGYSIAIGNSTMTYKYDANTQKLLAKEDNTTQLALSQSSYEPQDSEHAWDDGEGTGTDKTFTCTVCSATVTGAHPVHVAGEDWLVNESDVNHHWHQCTGCNEVMDYDEHSYTDYNPDSENQEQHIGTCVCGVTRTADHEFVEDKDKYVAPTVETEGSRTMVCAQCGYTKNEPVDKIVHEHNWSTWGGDDNNHWKECSAEGCGIEDNSQKDSYGAHQWNDGEITKEATETEAGVKTFTCKVCERTMTEQIPVTSKHNWGSTYSHDSKTHWLECSDKNCTITKNADKSGYGSHSYGAYRVITAATATTDGLMVHECLICGFSQTETIPASGVTDSNHTHSWGSWQFTSPNYWERTCTTCGNREINVTSTSSTTTTSTTASPSPYTMISGANQTWIRGNDTALSFRASMPYSEFSKVLLNDVELPSSYYTVSEGSTIITLNDNCTKELKTGVAHTIKIVSSGGDVVQTSFIVQNSSLSSSSSSTTSSYAWASPKTGDSANMGLWVTMVIVSLLGITAGAAVIIKKGKEE